MTPPFKIEPYTFPYVYRTKDGSGRRAYQTPSGKKYASVTTILQDINKEGIKRWEQRVGVEEANRIRNVAASRGSSFHKIVEKYLFGEENILKNQMPTSIVLFNSIKPILHKNIDVVHNIEFGLYSDRLELAGTADLLATWKGIKSLIDWKTASKAKKEDWILNYFYQCTLYSLMIWELLQIKVPQLVLVIAVENEQPQVMIKNVKDYIKPVLEFVKNYHQNHP